MHGRRTGQGPYAGALQVDLFTIVVDDDDLAIEFFVDTLGFELAGDSPSMTNDGRPKRWVVVRPPGTQTGVLLAQADGAAQAAIRNCRRWRASGERDSGSVACRSNDRTDLQRVRERLDLAGYVQKVNRRRIW